MSRIAGVVLMLATALILAGQDPKGDAALSGNAQNGKKLFVSIGCYECHGREAQGGAAGPRLAPRPLPAQALIMYVRHPAGAMPPYTSKVVSDQQLVDIQKFLLTIPQPPPAKSVPLLNQ